MKNTLSYIRHLYASPFYKYLPFFAAFAIILVGNGALVPGMWAFSLLVVLSLVLTDDLMPSLQGFLMMNCMSILGQPSHSTPLNPLPFMVPVVLAIVLHIIIYPKPFVPGSTFPGLLAAAAAALLGGLGTITAKEYFEPTALGYTLLLSLGLIFAYYVFVSQLRGMDRTVLATEFLKTMLLCGLLCGQMILMPYIRALLRDGMASGISEALTLELEAIRNPCVTILVTTMAAPFYFALRNRNSLPAKTLFFVTGCGLYCICLISMSRAGMLIGTGQAAICITHTLVREKKPAVRMLNAAILIVGISVLGIVFRDTIRSILEIRFGEGLIRGDESRVYLLIRSLEDWKRNPLFGAGLGYQGNWDIYWAEGCICWYHSFFPQIYGSMGLFGLVAWGYQMFLRGRVMLRHWDKCSISISLIYIGLFLFSQTDPGEFSPLPYALIAVLAFVILEDRPLTPRLKKGAASHPPVTVDKTEEL